MTSKEQTFEEAMKAAILWCNAWEEGALSDEVLAERISELLTNRDSARGFFAISLSSNCPLMDRIPEALVLELRVAGEIVVDLIVRNLAMSSAMKLHHQRQGNLKKQAGKTAQKGGIFTIAILGNKSNYLIIYKDKIK